MLLKITETASVRYCFANWGKEKYSLHVVPADLRVSVGTAVVFSPQRFFHFLLAILCTFSVFIIFCIRDLLDPGRPNCVIGKFMPCRAATVHFTLVCFYFEHHQCATRTQKTVVTSLKEVYICKTDVDVMCAVPAGRTWYADPERVASQSGPILLLKQP